MSTIPKGNGPVLFRMMVDDGDACEVRGHDYPVVVALESMAIPDGLVPVVFDHERTFHIGHATQVKVVGGRLVASGSICRASAYDDGLARNFLKSAWSEPLQVWQVSSDTPYREIKFVHAGERKKVNGRWFVGPCEIIRNSRLRNVSIVAPLGAAVAESSVIVEGSPSWNLFPGEFTPTRTELQAALIIHERGMADLERDWKRFRQQMDEECRERAAERFVAEINAAPIRKGERDAAAFRERYQKQQAERAKQPYFGNELDRNLAALKAQAAEALRIG